MHRLTFLMWLHLKNTITPCKGIELIECFGSAEKVYLADKKSYMEHGITNPAVLKSLTDKNICRADKEIMECARLGIRLIGYGMEEYPEILGEIPDPPLILYVRGDVSVLHCRNAFCIVGTRRSTVYGMSAALGVSEQLARCGMVIVSGVAVGIDSAAHRGAVRGGGKTIGIMGCGLDVEYPAENGDVRKAIIENGALISEFPLGTPPFPGNFPIRNRLLSAFSLGVAVMEASERSGALITAKYAAEQGRDVFALPGNISSPMSAGTNALIQDGAALLTGADSILAEYIMRYPDCFSTLEIEPEETTAVSKEEAATLQNPGVTAPEKKVYKVMGKEPLHVNEIARLSETPIHEVQAMITMLQIKGKIKEHPGNRYSTQ